MLKQNRAITLLEVLIVVLVLGILFALAMPRFGTMKERALDKEAKSNLKLLQVAEKIYRMETGFYYPAPASSPQGTASINTNLKLAIPTGPGRNWNYSASGGNALDAQAQRFNPPAGWGRTYYIDHDDQGDACCCPTGGIGSQCLTQDQCSSCP